MEGFLWLLVFCIYGVLKAAVMGYLLLLVYVMLLGVKALKVYLREEKEE